ncbi:MAG: glycosyltransferase [Alphaproteobacteria bacterium]|nr:glycosyltransferase [Alphaproteobacteria bacterium]
MKIVDVCEFYSPTGGGVRRYINQKLALAGKFGHQLTIIAPGAETRQEQAHGGTIAWIKSPHLPFDRNYRMFWNHQQVWRTLDKIAPDLVEGSSPWRGGWLAARWPGKAVKVFFMHADPVAVYPQTFLGGMLGPERVDRLFGFFWRYLNSLNSNYDAAIVTNPALKERFSGFGLENIELAPFGVERSNFSADFYDATARREMLATCGLDADAKLLIAVGRHHPEKRLRTLIQAVSKAQKQRKIGLYIAGDGFLRASVERWALNAQNVYVAGQINDADHLATMMASADALIHGSAAETFGLVLAEALCSGTPLVVPDSGASATFAGPGYAETYRAGDAADGAAAILRLLAGDRPTQSRAALAAAGAQVFNVEQHFEKLFEIYGRIVAERSTR